MPELVALGGCTRKRYSGWAEPAERLHRGVNVGAQPYEEVTVFFLDRPDAVPQPRAE